MTIPDNLKPPSFGTIYTETELRQAIANGEVQNLLGVGGGVGGTSGGSATAANQQEIIADTDSIEDILYSVWDEDVGQLKVADSDLTNNVLNFAVGNRNSNPATSDTGDFTLNSLFKRLLSVKLDKPLSIIETAINNLTDGKSLRNIENALLSLKFTFYNTFSTSEITSLGQSHSVDMVERGKNISFQYEVDDIGTSLTLEIQFSNNQGKVNAQGSGTAIWSRLNEKDIIVTQYGVQEPIIINNVPASHIRLIMTAVNGGNPRISSYAMVSK